MKQQPAFERLSFERKVNAALQGVQRVLEVERRPMIAGDVEHNFGSKYILADAVSNVAVIGYMNVLDRMGLNCDVLKSIDKKQATTLRFEATLKSEFVKEVVVDLPMDMSFEEERKTKSTGIFGNTDSKRVSKVVQRVTEFHYKIETSWSLSIFAGTSTEGKQVIKSRTASTNIITRNKDGVPQYMHIPPLDLSLTWLLKQINTAMLTSQFKVDIDDKETKTPRRNKSVDEALDFSRQLARWSDTVRSNLTNKIARTMLDLHNPALPQPLDFSLDGLNVIHQEHSIHNPILPLMEEASSEQKDSNQVQNDCAIALSFPSKNDEDSRMLLSIKDLSKLLNEHCRTLGNAANAISQSCPAAQSNSAISCVEYEMVLFTHHIAEDLCKNYTDCMAYIESMMETQLISAVGKRLTPDDFDSFVRYHNAKFLSPAPQPFSYAISRSGHNPVGLISIERASATKDECIYSHSRVVNAGSTFNVPLNTATTLEVEGVQMLHGWLNHRFESNHTEINFIARARQFSSFIVVIGTMTSKDSIELEPKDAFIVQNKDEITIPLLASELPTAREFKDAIKSLSPKQQQFARAFRAMQLASSVFGFAVVQIKPQLETLLGLPPDSLDKEMKLTNDLMELFVEYQVPSDLLSYNGVDDNAEDKVLKVKQNVKAVLDVIEGEKEKQLKAAMLNTEMAIEGAFQRAAYDTSAYAAPAPIPRAGVSNRRLMKSAAPPREMMAMTMAAEPPPDMMAMTMAAAPPQMAMDDIPMAESSPTAQLFGSSGSARSESRHYSDAVEYRSSRDVSQTSPNAVSQRGLDFTLLPKVLDARIENSGSDTSLRSTVLKTSDNWVRRKQENILSPFKTEHMKANDIKKEKGKAFDLLDALSRSGTLPIKNSELHVVVAVTHCFEKDLIDTIVCDNVDPIEKIEMSTLLFASTIHNISARELIKPDELRRLEGTMPLLLEQQQNEEEKVGGGDGDNISAS